MQVSGVKHTSSSKVVVVVLPLCVILTTIAVVSSITCYFHRKEKYPIEASALSSEEALSYNSATNLINNGTFLTQTKLNITSPIHPSTGTHVSKPIPLHAFVTLYVYVWLVLYAVLIIDYKKLSRLHILS